MNGLVFLRHAETDMAGTFCGHSDPPINARGRAQVDELVARFASDRLDAIYSSDSRRAVDTAMPIASIFALPCQTTPLLREMNFGRWESMTWSHIEQQDQSYARRWLDEFPALAAPGGEEFAAFEHRVLQQVLHLRRLARDKRVAVVTHGGVMRIVLRAILGRAEQEAWEVTRSYCCSFLCGGEDAL